MVDLAKIPNLLSKHQLSSFLVTSAVNIYYLSGLQSTNALVLLTSDELHVYTDPRYEAEARSLPGVVVHIGRDLIRMAMESVNESEVLCVDESLNYLQSLKIKELLPQVDIVIKPGVIEDLRAIKSQNELANIQTACEITSQVWLRLIGETFTGRTEKEIARRIQTLVLELGGDALAFDAIVAGGVNSASPHHTPNDYAFQKGDLIKCDFGAKFAGYHSDMTRMAVVGKPSAWQQELYDIVLLAQQTGVKAIQSGVSSSVIDKSARGVIDAAGFQDSFTHPAGHGIGLEIHEIPIHGSRDITLCPSMALTVEPGIYLKGRGGVRLEDTLVVREQGCENLTTASKALVEVE